MKLPCVCVLRMTASTRDKLGGPEVSHKFVAGLTSDCYYIDIKTPLIELESTDPADIAQYFLDESHGPLWFDKMRAPLTVGDAFWVDGTAWVLVPSEAYRSHRNSVMLVSWSEYALMPRRMEKPV